MKLLGSGPDMVAELMDGDRAEGGAEGGLPQSFGGQAAVEEVSQYHHRPSPGSMLA